MHRYILSIEGMRCGMCESHINDLIRETGYTLLEIRCETFEKKRFRLFHR